MTTPEQVASRVDWKGHAKRLADAVLPHEITLLELSWGETQKKFPAIGSFTLKNPEVQKVIPTLAKRITGISEYSRTEVTSMLEQAFTATETIPGTDELARRFRTISELEAPEGATRQERSRAVRRAQLIANTETGMAMNQGAILSYREAKIEKVEVLDGDGDDICAEANGQIWTLEQAEENPLGHPGCTRSFAPVVD